MTDPPKTHIWAPRVLEDENVIRPIVVVPGGMAAPTKDSSSDDETTAPDTSEDKGA